MPLLHVLRVFTDPAGRHGNPLGVFLEGGAVPESRRQAVAAWLDYSETIFVESAERGRIRIFTPEKELPFAGHPSVGSAWLLARESAPVSSLEEAAGTVPVRHEGELTWIAGRPEWAPSLRMEQLGSVGEVEAFDSGGGLRDRYCWAWEDEETGAVRARAFFPSLGIAEDEATGSAALVLCARLARPIEIRQGRGSQLLARPIDGGMVEVGGRCILDEVLDYSISPPGSAARPA
jgi:predicted PhzF superfamily epimerase YddE/YHI9